MQRREGREKVKGGYFVHIWNIPSISIFHLYHEYTILLKVVVVRYDVGVIQHAENLNLITIHRHLTLHNYKIQVHNGSTRTSDIANNVHLEDLKS